MSAVSSAVWRRRCGTYPFVNLALRYRSRCRRWRRDRWGERQRSRGRDDIVRLRVEMLQRRRHTRSVVSPDAGKRNKQNDGRGERERREHSWRLTARIWSNAAAAAADIGGDAGDRSSMTAKSRDGRKGTKDGRSKREVYIDRRSSEIRGRIVRFASLRCRVSCHKVIVMSSATFGQHDVGSSHKRGDEIKTILNIAYHHSSTRLPLARAEYATSCQVDSVG